MAAVYRLYDDADNLLYIGCGYYPEARIKAHRSQQPWAGDIHRHKIEWFPTRDEAYQVEQRAIIAEEPRHNKARWVSPAGPRPAGEGKSRIGLVLDSDLVEWLQEDGRRNGRNLAQTVRFHLKQVRARHQEAAA